MRQFTVIFLVVILVVTFLGNLGNAHSLSPTTLILKAQFDAYVSENNPRSCYGREVVLDVRSFSKDGNHFNHRTYITFDISNLSKNILIVSASLWLYKNPEGANPRARNIQAFRVTEAWNEITLNWNNQPAVLSEPTVSTLVGGPLEWYSWDLTKDVIAWYKGSAINHGTMLKDGAEDSGTDYASVFLSREASHPQNPYLEIKYTQLPVRPVTTATQTQIVDNQLLKDLVIWAPALLVVIIIAFAMLRWKTSGKKANKELHSRSDTSSSLFRSVN